MQSIPDDPNAVVEMAIKFEIEGHRILQQAKEASSEPLAIATFEFLANEELKHIEIIKEYSKTLEGAKKWNPDMLKGLTLAGASTGIRGIFERFGAQFEEAGTAPDQRMEVYKVAMDMERRGYDFYSSASEKSTDKKSQNLYRFLAGEEMRHFRIIQDTHDFLDHPDGFFAIEERWMQI